jgi:hypothetical protein
MRRVALLPLTLVLQLGCGEGDIITLGQGDPRPRFLDAGRAIGPINSPWDDDNPTLTEDMLEIFFTSDRPDPGESDGEDDENGDRDVYYAKREFRTEPFGAPEKVLEASSEDEETSSVISPDGLMLWVGTDRALIDGNDNDDDDHDIWFTTRASRESKWETLRPLSELNTEFDDIPRPLALNGTIMPIASRRSTRGGAYETFLARRATVADEFSPDEEPIPEISVEDRSSVDAFMTNDGLLLFFNRAEGPEEGELFMSWRRSPSDPFSEPLPLDAIGGDDYRDPWVDKDGTRFVFTSNRGDGQGELDIYMAFIQLPSSRDLASR